jgi:hypothetical protein
MIVQGTRDDHRARLEVRAKLKVFVTVISFCWFEPMANFLLCRIRWRFEQFFIYRRVSDRLYFDVQQELPVLKTKHSAGKDFLAIVKGNSSIRTYKVPR